MSRDEERLLGMLGDALAPEPAEPPADRVAHLRAQASRPRRGRELALAAAACVATLVAVVTFRAITVPPPVPTEPVTFSQIAPDVDAAGELIAHTWGTELQLVVTGLEQGAVYTVDVERADGTSAGAGTFIGVRDDPVRCNLNTAVLRPDAARFEVTSEDGNVVLAGNL